MSFIKDDYIPVCIADNVQHILPTNEINRSYHFICRAKNGRVSIKNTSIDKRKRNIKFYSHFIFLPLFGQAAWGDNKYALNDLSH